MKKLFSVLLSVMALLLTACGTSHQETDLTPDVSQMKAICELSVMECYYHNVAKYYDEDAESFLLWSKDKEFWIEYSGVVRLGVDASHVAIQVEGDTVSITLPEATVLGCKVDGSSLTQDSYIVAEGSAKITADDQTKAFAKAQSDMEQAAAEDSALLAMAQQRARKLLEDYIQNLSQASGHTYTIQWKDAPAEETSAPVQETPAES